MYPREPLLTPESPGPRDLCHEEGRSGTLGCDDHPRDVGSGPVAPVPEGSPYGDRQGPSEVGDEVRGRGGVGLGNGTVVSGYRRPVSDCGPRGPVEQWTSETERESRDEEVPV